jgi:gliding motility-associated-like protein
VNCPRTATGAISLVASGTTPPYTFNWSNGATIQNLSGLSKGFYNVSVTDNLGCRTIVTNEITEPNSLQIDKTYTNVNCFSASTGAINITVTGGTGGYTYDWADIAGANNIEDRTNLAAGTYDLTVTDGNGCSATTSVIISQPAAALNASTAVTNLTCNGVAEGIVNLTVTDGTAPYTYTWNGGATTEDLNNLTTGTYNVTVTDDNGCTTTASAIVTQPTALSLSHTKVNVLCNGGKNGSVNLTASGGTGAYTYIWSSGEITEDIATKSAGNYAVTVTDVNGCNATIAAALIEPTALSGSITATNISCNGNATGALNLTVSGGTLPYTFLWSSGETTEDIASKSAGNYALTVTDANGCTVLKSAVITEPTALTLTGAATNVSCNAGTNGAINITATGGTGVLSYNWGGGITTEDRTALSVGAYSVTVTDGNTCTINQNFAITEPTALVLSTTKTDVTCNGAANGRINLTANGGVLPYTFLWSNSATTEDISALSGGSKAVTVTDANGCTANISTNIIEPTALSTTPTVTNVTCFGGSTGSVSTITSGGVLPYIYAWSNGTTTANISSKKAGNYTLTVTDANGCTTQTANTITEPVAALAVSGIKTNLACFGNTNGSITTTTIGGTAPYVYAWSNTATTANLNTLTAGTYTLTVTDNKLCTANSTFFITQPTASLAVSSTKVDVKCNGNTNGSIDLVVSGGTLPYTYNWSNGASTEDIANLTIGTYGVTVTDAQNCTAITSVVITQPTALNVSSTATNAGCEGGNVGAVNLTVSGGVLPYTFNWSNGTTTEDITSLIAGVYSVTVTDANGCTAITNNTITQFTNPTASIVAVENSCTSNDEKVLNGDAVNFTASGGTTYTWNNGLGSGAAKTVTPSLSTIYNVTVTDGNGCTATASKKIDVISGATATITSSESYCFSNDDKILNGDTLVFFASGGLNYSWNNSLGTNPTQVVHPTANTNYSVTVTDVNGCTATAFKTVEIVTPPTASIVSTENSCTINDDKILLIDSVRLIASGSLNYAWDNGLGSVADVIAFPNETTTYTVTITDANGCTATASKIIQVVTAPATTITGDTTINKGETTTLTASGGTTFVWSNTAATAPITISPTATTQYFVTATDANGCADTANVTVLVNDAAVANRDNITIPEDNGATTINVLINDYFGNDGADTAAITLIKTPTNGIATVNNNGTPNNPTDDTIIYTPNANYNGTDTLIYRICDINNECDTALVIISVSPINDAPVAVNDTITTKENTPVSGSVATNDTDTEGGALTYTPISIPSPNAGILTFNPDGTYTFTPAANFTDTVKVTYKVCDANNDCDTAVLTIIVTPDNNPPVANDDYVKMFENTVFNGNVLVNDNDPNGDTLIVNTVPILPPFGGTVTINPNGTFIYTPDPGFIGLDTFSYQVCDNRIPAKCDTAYVNIVVGIETITTTLDTTVYINSVDTICLNADELMGNTLRIRNVCAADSGVVNFTRIPNSPCIITTAKAEGVGRACFVICDEFGFCDTTYIIINVKESILIPKIKVQDDTVKTKQNQPIVIGVILNDSLYNDSLNTITIIINAHHGTAQMDSLRNIIYTPDQDFCGKDSITYEICNAAGCGTGVVTILVICPKIKIYTGFSPNDDGINDNLIIEGLEQLTTYNFEVYNRWGNKVFFSNNYKNDWKGTWNGMPLPDGSYFYYIEDKETGQSYVGYIQIQR